MLADQPLLTLDDIKKMTDVFLGDPTKIVACSVDVSKELVTVYRGDTSVTKDGEGAWGSRSAILIGER